MMAPPDVSSRRAIRPGLGDIEHRWDLIVVGGGITGAGIFREATRLGLSVLLLEQRDFAWGTSSRSSKMVHGGLRYLIQGKPLLSLASVRERERLLTQAPGLVDPLGFAMAVYKAHGPSKHLIRIALTLYSLMAGKRQHECLNPKQMQQLIPLLRTERLDAGFCFRDAQADDARLVLRLIQEGQAEGGTALNYTKVVRLERAQGGRVAGVTAEDLASGVTAELRTRVVINATGPWAEDLHPSPVQGFHIRPLRGSHLIFPATAVSLSRVLSFFHPRDKRPVFLYPWEDRLMVGTTDVDHGNGLDCDPCIHLDEATYLMEALHHILPGANVPEADCISSFAGVRPVLSSGGKSASKESRDHVVWEDNGLVTVTGGKLTTFRLIAQDALKAAKHALPQLAISKSPSIFDPINASSETDPVLSALEPRAKVRLIGRYGNRAADVAGTLGRDGISAVPQTLTLWCELAYAAASEQVRHLSDLLLRRVRIGQLLPDGGKEHFARIEQVCKPALGWDDARWAAEVELYRKEWQTHYAPPF